MSRRPPPLEPGAPPLAERRSWLITWVVLAGAFCVSFTITILSVSRPAIAKDLDADVSTLVWLISGPTLAMALVSASAGKLGDLRGHRRVYLAGLAGATVFSVASALAWDGGSLIAFRVLGAVAGASTGPCAMAIINRLFAPDRRAAALGYWSLVVAGGPVVGLVAGGPLVDLFGWRMIFVLQAPLMAAAFLAAFLVVPETPTRPEARFDVRGQLTLATAVLSVLLAVDRGRSWGWTSPAVLALFALGVAAVPVFLRVESRAPEPLLPLRYLRRRDFSVPVAMQFLVNFGYMGGFILAPKLLDEVRGLSAGVIALMLIPRPLVFALSGPVAGSMVTRLGVRRFAFFGAACVTLSLGALAAVSGDPATGWVVAAIVVSGLGMGSAQPALASSVANSVGDEDLGVAGATQQLLGQVGASMGMNVLDAIQVGRAPVVGTSESFAAAYLAGAFVSGAGVALSLLLRSSRARGAPDPGDREEVRAQLSELP